MKIKTILFAFVLFLSTLLFMGGNNSAQAKNIDSEVQKAQYSIDVMLDDKNKLLDAKQTVEYTVKADTKVIYFKIYPNAFEIPDEKDYPEIYSGRINVSKIKVNNQKVDFDIEGTDGSTLKIYLNEEAYTGEHLTIDLKYQLDIPYYGVRFGYNPYNEIYNFLFWYPVVAMYDDEGWNLDPFTFSGEVYYNEVADYNVTIKVPGDFKLVSSGSVTSTLVDDENIKYIINAENARDFSFSTSPNYSVYEEEHNDILFRISSINPLDDYQLNEIFSMVKRSFDFYENIIGDYPYDEFDIELGNVYGMESSGAIYCDGYDISNLTLIHEIVHQWTFGIIGNDQGDESWLDEGLTTYITGLYFREYPEDFYKDVNNYYGLTYQEYYYYTIMWRYSYLYGPSIIRNIHDFDYGYGFYVYFYGGAIIDNYVDNILYGDYELFYDILREYYNQYKFEVATVDDFIRIIEEVSGVEETDEYFYDHLYHSSNPYEEVLEK